VRRARHSTTTTTTASAAMKTAMTTTVTTSAVVTPTRARARDATRGTTTMTRAVDVGVATAVAQQDVAFAVCVLGEAFATRERVAEGTPGRPNLGFVGPASGALVGAFALIQSDNELTTPTGLALAATATLALGYQYARRFDETPRNPLEWPGPRLYPTLGVMFSLFAFLANAEALPRVLSPLAV
jgi:hypothetical protein